MSAETFEAIERRLRGAEVDGLAVARYRMGWRAFEVLSAGVRDNSLAGVYKPIRAEKGLAGSYLVQWSDGSVSRGNLDGASLPNFEELLAAAADSRREDPDAAVFPGPQDSPGVPLDSPDVEGLFERDPAPISQAVKALLEHGEALGARNTSGAVTATRSHAGVWTSEGLRVDDRTTRLSFYSYLDGEVGMGYSSRSLLSPEEMVGRLGLHDQLFRATREERPWEAARETTTVLHPDAVEAFLDHFVLTNLSGSGVVHGQSRWSAEDFQRGELVFREDLSFGVEPHVPLHPGSYNFTGEGVVTSPVRYIAGGRLREPVLNLKYARKLGRSPTTPPRSSDSLRLELSVARPWEDLLPELDDAVLVVDVLGMHTQDPVRGDYSLAVPTAVRVERGSLAGKCRVVLNDNFFRNLRAADLQAITFRHHDLPGLAFRSVVASDKGRGSAP